MAALAHVLFLSVSFCFGNSLHIRADGTEKEIAAIYRSFPLAEHHDQQVEVEMRQFIAGIAAVPAPAREQKSPALVGTETCEPDFDRKSAGT